jgi:hypothetical protein
MFIEDDGARELATDPNSLREIWDDPDFTFVVQTVTHVRRGKPVETGPDQVLIYDADGAIDRVVSLGVGGADWLFAPDLKRP